ncbi:TRAP transporter small permease subunit [Microvirga pudoricolor]|uniref:TRAP transporter small permease subunit n=1 Tax=Microvirga pudoricolor TaxID=2778729 RepID=UPI00194E586D|nr:TRAP transporter small permease [Microvirga pudoricolor]MBM6596698.1 TRAP transporter small permease [Microvirga pudoricolor]
MITRFNRAVGDLFSYGYIIVFLLTFYEVLARYLLNAPTQYTLEITLILAGLHYLLCGPQVSADNGHIAVTTITDHLSPRWQERLRRVGLAVSLACCLILIWASWNQAAFAIEVNEHSGTIFNSPLPIILKVALFVSFVLMALQSFSYLIEKKK